jgi:hypothetical protein
MEIADALDTGDPFVSTERKKNLRPAAQRLEEAFASCALVGSVMNTFLPEQ